MIVLGGTSKFRSKLTCGDLSDGRTTTLVLGVVLVVDGAPAAADCVVVIVVVALVDGIIELYTCDSVLSG